MKQTFTDPTQSKHLPRASLTKLLVLFAVVLATLAACMAPDTADLSSESNAAKPGGGTQPASVTTKTGLPCEVDKILKEKCQSCHGAQPAFGAPNSLVTWDDLQKPGAGGAKTFERIKARAHDDARPMPPSPQARLSEKENAVIDQWIAGGAKNDGATCVGAPPPEAVKPLSCTPDQVVKGKPFTVAGGPLDQYVCFGVDINTTTRRHVTAFGPLVDNKQLVHHILLFQTAQSVSPEPQACEPFGSAAWKLIGGWAPGGGNFELPPEAGLPEEKGTTHWVVQLHYNTGLVKNGTDNSGFQLCTTDKLRPNDAGILGFGGVDFLIPPRASHKVRCDYKLGLEFANRKFVNAWPHMHEMGTEVATERIPGGTGTPEPVFEQKNFSFESQQNFPIDKSVAPGDVIRTRCAWKNPTDKAVDFGEETGEEMCFNFFAYYPAIPDFVIFGLPLFSWITPALTSKCTPE